MSKRGSWNSWGVRATQISPGLVFAGIFSWNNSVVASRLGVWISFKSPSYRISYWNRQFERFSFDFRLAANTHDNVKNDYDPSHLVTVSSSSEASLYLLSIFLLILWGNVKHVLILYWDESFPWQEPESFANHWASKPPGAAKNSYWQPLAWTSANHTPSDAPLTQS